ncbi:MAG: mammalian cell entry domain-containing protein [bacterium]|nr:MAG: mammalian cell entry domain-containing protein [bacterium]
MKRYGDLSIGITVLAALALLIFGVLWFKGFTTNRESWKLTAYFPQSSGLVKGDPVEVAGVVQGKVDEIIYDRGQAKLVLDLNKSAELYADARIAIANYGMMGQKYVAIDPGKPALGPLDTSKPMIGDFQPGVGDMMTEVGQSLAATNLLVDRLNRFLAVIDSTGGASSISHSINNLEVITGNVSALTADNRGKLASTVANFEAASGELRALLSEKGPTLGRTFDNLEQATLQADSTARDLPAALRGDTNRFTAD